MGRFFSCMGGLPLVPAPEPKFIRASFTFFTCCSLQVGTAHPESLGVQEFTLTEVRGGIWNVSTYMRHIQ